MQRASQGPLFPCTCYSVTEKKMKIQLVISLTHSLLTADKTVLVLTIQLQRRYLHLSTRFEVIGMTRSETNPHIFLSRGRRFDTCPRGPFRSEMRGPEDTCLSAESSSLRGSCFLLVIDYQETDDFLYIGLVFNLFQQV